MADATSTDTSPSNDAPYRLLVELLERFPARLAGSPAERGAQEMLAAAFAEIGGEATWRTFEWPPHLYGSLALHFGVGVLGAALAKRHPLAALALQATTAVSIVAELTRKGLILHRLLGSTTSQNLLVTFRPPGEAGTEPARRLVLLAHADSAYTGVIFNPDVIKASLKPPPKPLGFLKKQLRLPTASLFALAGLSAARLLGASGTWVDVATALFALPPAIVSGLNIEVVVRDHVVPGAADNVSGCVSLVELARRLAPVLPPGTELVTVITGSEESGTGGAYRLAEQMAGTWDKATTTVLAIDTMTNGELVSLEEGELFRVPVPERLRAAIQATSAEPGMLSVREHPIPAGATDALPFLAHGYEAAALTSIDRDIGAPRHYHHPTDIAANVDPLELRRSIDFAERLCLRLLAPPA
jgi:hypothetical protein